jgi:NAD(P)-dependent dehydrogenase (short-subunit alcohol dehydrogenase family)
METNYFGALRCIQAVVPGMRERGGGDIINVSSIEGRISVSPDAPYAALKWALKALSEALAQEVKPFGIQVSIVEPGTPLALPRGEGQLHQRKRGRADARPRKPLTLTLSLVRERDRMCFLFQGKKEPSTQPPLRSRRPGVAPLHLPSWKVTSPFTSIAL